MRLPPMNAVVSFEAAGRHESLVMAAEELGVTPGAVSRQVKHLEQAIGIRLFDRDNRKLTLTDEGRAYWAAMNGVIARVRYETEQIVRRKADPALAVSCSISFLQHWMLPRYLSFQAAVPDLNVSFAITRSIQAFPPEFDCGIRIRREPWPDFSCERLLPAPMAAICSPRYIANHPEIRSLDDLREHTLLYSTANEDHWANWLGADSDRIIDDAKKIKLDGSGVLYQAVLNGLGIGLGRVCLIGDDLLYGRLIVLLPEHTMHDDNLFLITRPETKLRPEFKAFRSWLSDELGKFWLELKDAFPNVLR